MSRNVAVGRKALFEDRRRAVMATGGVGIALLLVLLLQGIFDGATREVTSYLRHSPADVFVAEKNVRTMHMSMSTLDPATAATVATVDGVAWVEPIRFTSGTFLVGPDGTQQLSYVIGYDAMGGGRGGPRKLTTGHPPGMGEIALEALAADRLKVRVGETVQVFDHTFRVSGLFRGGTTIASSIAFITSTDFAALRGAAIGFVLVGARPGVDTDQLVQRVSAAIPEATVQTRDAFVHEEASLVADMASDLMRIMATIAFLIALAVVGLTLLTLTLTKQRDYAVMKALGAGGARLARTVLGQALWSISLAMSVATSLAVVLGAIVERLSPAVAVAVQPGSAGRVAAGALIAGMIGALAPLRRIAAVDPAAAFRRVS